MWLILFLKFCGVVVVAFSKRIVNACFDVYEYFEDEAKDKKARTSNKENQQSGKSDVD